MKFEFMDNNTKENPPQESEDDNVNADFELDEKTSEEMENAMDNHPEIKEYNELSEEEKLEKIEERGDKIKEIADEIGLDLEKNVEETRDELKKRYEEYAEMESGLSQVRGSNIEAGEGLDKMKEILSSVKGVYENQLEIEYLEYWKKYKENPKLLLDSHAERNLLMNNWETLIGNMKADLEKTGEEEEEVLRRWAQWVKDNPELTLAALTALIVAGVAVTALLTPEIIATLPAIPGMPGVDLSIVKEGASVAAKMISNTTGAVGGTVVGVGILGKAVSWLSDEDNIKKFCGTDFPGWYYTLGGKKAGEKK